MKKVLLLLAQLALAFPFVAQAERGLVSGMGDCVDGSPRHYDVVNGFTATDCSAGGGTYDVACCCLDGVWATCDSGGGGGGGAPTTLDYFVGTATGSLSAERVGTDTATIDVDLGTAGQVKFNVLTPVASASDLSGCTNCIGGTEVDESTLGAVPTATAFAANPGDCTGAANEYAWRINATGDLSCDSVTFPDSASMILDIGDDGGNDSTALLELSTLNDDYAALSEPSADEAQINFAKIPPYQQWDPNRPPTTCATCDEFTGSVTLSFSWQNQESSTATATRDGLRLDHPADATGIAAYWLTGPAGSSTDWAMHTRITGANQAAYNQAGLIVLATGTQATPTLMYMIELISTTGSVNVVGVRSMTSYTSAQTGLGTDFNTDRAGFLSIGYVSSTKVLSFYYSADGYNYRAVYAVTLGAHPTTSMGFVTSAINASLGSSGFFHFLRIRTDAGRLEVGE